MHRMHRVTRATDAGVLVQRTATTTVQAAIFRALKLTEPPRFFDFAPTSPRDPARPNNQCNTPFRAYRQPTTAELGMVTAIRDRTQDCERPIPGSSRNRIGS